MTGQHTDLKAFALLAVGLAVGAGVALVDGSVLPADLAGVPIVLLGGLATVLLARARRSETSLFGG